MEVSFPPGFSIVLAGALGAHETIKNNSNMRVNKIEDILFI
jgi:hypothetical protein